ncbi:MAG: sensor histidine kinase [Myxococcaceae bacterium]
MSSSAPPRPRVLVCDDSRTILTVIEGLLEPLHECVLTSSAEEALARAAEVDPDLIISDVVMTGMSGYDLCRSVRREPRFRHVPVILLTSAVDEDSRALGLELGADDYLYKPVRSRDLLARVASLLRLRRTHLDLELRSQQLERANRRLQQTQDALVQAEKLATVGTLVAGVAHEVNNPLAFMKAGAEAIPSYLNELEEVTRRAAAHAPAGARAELEKASGELGGELRAIASELTAGVNRLQRIAVDLRAFAEPTVHRAQEVDLRAELDRAWQLSGAEVLHKPAWVLQCEKLAPVRLVPELLGQVLVSIFANAIQAVGGSGTVWTSARFEGDEVLISIRDSGPGIPPQHLNRVFDPFFTTKPPGLNTGLGLSVSYRITASMGGRLEVASPAGKGACFTVRLPRGWKADDYNQLRGPAASQAMPR